VTPNRIRIKRIRAQTCYVTPVIEPPVNMPECRPALARRTWWLSNKKKASIYNSFRSPTIDINKPVRLTCLSNAVRESDSLPYTHSAVNNCSVQNCFNKINIDTCATKSRHPCPEFFATETTESDAVYKQTTGQVYGLSVTVGVSGDN